MLDQRKQSIAYANANHAEFLNTLIDLLHIPSISTNDEAKPDMLAAAEWLASHMRNLGLENIRVYPTAGHPVVYGDWLHAGENLPTVLIYGHYDVQPPDPLELWVTDPFTPTVRDNALYARGASDMKGQVLASLNAVESILHCDKLPLNIKFIIEGEEEIGSPSLGQFLREHKDLLKCDVALNPDAGMIAPDVPTDCLWIERISLF